MLKQKDAKKKKSIANQMNIIVKRKENVKENLIVEIIKVLMKKLKHVKERQLCVKMVKNIIKRLIVVKKNAKMEWYIKMGNVNVHQDKN